MGLAQSICRDELAFPRLLGLVEGLVGPLEEADGVVVRAELSKPRREVQALEGPIGRALTANWTRQ